METKAISKMEMISDENFSGQFELDNIIEMLAHGRTGDTTRCCASGTC